MDCPYSDLESAKAWEQGYYAAIPDPTPTEIARQEKRKKALKKKWY